MQLLPYCVYVLYSLSDGNFYIGFTANLEQRLKAHTDGSARSTSTRRPFQPLYVEFHTSEADALRREHYFKSTKGKRALRLMITDGLKEASLRR